jgi:xanthine dehydrogenase accessory factor
MITAPDISAAAAADAALAAHAGGRAVAIALLANGPQAGARMLFFEDGETRGTLGSVQLDRHARNAALDALSAGKAFSTDVICDDVACTIFVESHIAADELLIVGAGHIALPLASFAVDLGFRVTVLDDRTEFADAARFPAAVRVLHTDFAAPFENVSISGRTSIVLVTRAHKYDFDCLRELLRSDVHARYIGMVGSKRRVRAALSALLEEGVPRERLAVLRTPVGLDIGAETPAEIALSIAAELVLVRRGGTGAALSAQARVLDRLLPDAPASSVTAVEQ